MPAQVLFDGECPLCLKSIQLLRRLDWLHRLDYVNVRQPNAILDEIEIPKDRLLQEMHLVTPHGVQIYHGFGAFRWMAWRLPALWLIAPFMYLPGVPWLGQKLYLWVARNRLQLLPCHGGVCSIKQKK